MNAATRYSTLVGRILLSLIFIVSGVGKIANWSATAGYMAHAGMVFVPFFLVMAIIIELVGGLSVLTGYYARIGALALIVFLIPTTLIFHNFWASPPDQQQIQMVNFLKNLSIMGALLMVGAMGPGPMSIGSGKAD